MTIHLKDSIMTILNDCNNPNCCRLGSHTLAVKNCIKCKQPTYNNAHPPKMSNCLLCFDCEIETKSCGHCLSKLE